MSEALKENDIFLLAPCGGYGRCGKCKIKVTKGSLPITDEDRKYLSMTELESGIRLACRACPTQDIAIEILGDANSVRSLDKMMIGNEARADECKTCWKDIRRLGIALDIGTTTLAGCLVDITSEKIIDTITSVNSQAAFGADVISRIDASNKGHGKELKRLILSDIKSLIAGLLSHNDFSYESIDCIVIAANTTMVHLLMGYSCEKLGVYPFKSENLATVKIKASKLLDIDKCSALVTILPGISAFIGGDIVSGLLSIEADKRNDMFAFADLGTNAEMMVGNKDRMLFTSAAAGPAFEGGDLSCGIPAINGAICAASIDGESVNVKTIGDYPAEGLCGSGAVEIMSELLDKGIVDETGLMANKCPDGILLGTKEDGKRLLFTQEDVRTIQLAKGAIRAGFETLLDKARVDAGSLNALFLAGGFGYYLNAEKAVNIGLFPKEAGHIVTAVGNASLLGAVKYMILADADTRVDAIVSKSFEVQLATDDDFNRRFMGAMTF